MSRSTKSLRGLSLTFGLIALATGCGASVPTTETLKPTDELDLRCTKTPMTLATTLGWKTTCESELALLQSAGTATTVVFQKLGALQADPLMMLLAMLKTQPGLSDVQLSLTSVMACGDLTCLSYEASFQRLSRGVQRLGVIAVSSTESWEFATSYIEGGSADAFDRQMALLALHDLTNGISFYPEASIPSHGTF